MPIQEGTILPADQADSQTEESLYLLGSWNPRPIRCTTRWSDDCHAYVVAPLATARIARQQWRAMSGPRLTKRGKAQSRVPNVELVSANALLGADSGKEGLLLRFFEGKPNAV